MPDEPLMKFKLPEMKEVEGYAVEMPDGSIELRTKDQLAQTPKTGGTSGSDKGE